MEKLDFGKGAVPLYIQIKKIIKDKILSKEYAPGDSLPSEAQLQEIFHVSRITARQAIAQLESEGLVERARGKGTRVLFQNKIEEQLAGIKSFTNEMLERGIQPGTRWAHIELVKADRHVADIFGCKRVIWCIGWIVCGPGMMCRLCICQLFFQRQKSAAGG